MTQKLKQCPFCGGAATSLHTYDWHFVRCAKCYAKSCGSKDEKEAAEQWNTRHEAKRELVVNPSK